MPISATVDTQNRIVFFRCSGVVTEEEFVGTQRSANQDPRVTPEFSRLVDLSEVSELRVSPAGVRKLADIAREVPVRRRALVASNPLAFGMARMFEQNLLSSQGESQVFSDLPSAMEFLGLPRDTKWE